MTKPGAAKSRHAVDRRETEIRLTTRVEPWLPEILEALGGLAKLAVEMGVMDAEEAYEWARSSGEVFARRGVQIVTVNGKAAE